MRQFSKITPRLLILALSAVLFACELSETTSTPTVPGVPVCRGGTITVSFKDDTPSAFTA